MRAGAYLTQIRGLTGQERPARVPHVEEAPVFTERTSIGMDVHARSVRAAAIDTVTGEVIEATVGPATGPTVDWARPLATDHGPVAVTYEAGPSGYGLARALTAAGIRCEVAAPSKLIRPSGDRVKTDKKDALLLARLLRMEEFTGVRVPTPTCRARVPGPRSTSTTPRPPAC